MLHWSAFSLLLAAIHVLGERVALNGPPNGPPNAALKCRTKMYSQSPSTYSRVQKDHSLHQCLLSFTFASENTEDLTDYNKIVFLSSFFGYVALSMLHFGLFLMKALK